MPTVMMISMASSLSSKPFLGLQEPKAFLGCSLFPPILDTSQPPPYNSRSALEPSRSSRCRQLGVLKLEIHGLVIRVVVIRRPGQSRITTPRKETDTCRILSGVYEGL